MKWFSFGSRKRLPVACEQCERLACQITAARSAYEELEKCKALLAKETERAERLADYVVELEIFLRTHAVTPMMNDIQNERARICAFLVEQAKKEEEHFGGLRTLIKVVEQIEACAHYKINADYQAGLNAGTYKAERAKRRRAREVQK